MKLLSLSGQCNHTGNWKRDPKAMQQIWEKTSIIMNKYLEQAACFHSSQQAPCSPQLLNCLNVYVKQNYKSVVLHARFYSYYTIYIFYYVYH